MTASIAIVKDLKGKQAEAFVKAYNTSKVKDDAIEKALKSLKAFAKNK